MLTAIYTSLILTVLFTDKFQLEIMLTWAPGQNKKTLTFIHGRRGVIYGHLRQIHYIPAIFLKYISPETGWQPNWVPNLSQYLSDSEKERGRNCEHV